MNRHQLKSSLHELSPTTEQKQTMLRQIRQAKEAPKKQRTSWLWRMASAVVLLAVVVGLWQIEPNLKRAAPEADAQMAGEPAIELEKVEEPMVDIAEAKADEAFRSSFEDELTMTPWMAERTPKSMPVFMPSPGVVPGDGRDRKSTEDLSAEDRYVRAIVDYAVYLPLAQREQGVTLAVTDQVEIISFTEARQRLVKQTPGLKLEQIEAGYLSYTRPEEATLIHPIYRFRYTLDNQIIEAFVDARR